MTPSYVAAFEDPWYFEPNGLREAYDLIPKTSPQKIRFVVIDKCKVKFIAPLKNENYNSSTIHHKECQNQTDQEKAHATKMASLITGKEKLYKCKNCEHPEQFIKVKGITDNAIIDSFATTEHGDNIFKTILYAATPSKYNQKIIPIQDAQICELINISMSTEQYNKIKHDVVKNSSCCNCSLYKSLNSINTLKGINGDFNNKFKKIWFIQLLNIRDKQENDNFNDAWSEWKNYLLDQLFPHYKKQLPKQKRRGLKNTKKSERRKLVKKFLEKKRSEFLSEMEKCGKKLYEGYSKTLPNIDIKFQELILHWRTKIYFELKSANLKNRNFMFFISAGNNYKEIKAVASNNDLPRASALLVTMPDNSIRIGALQKYSSNTKPKKANFSNYGADYIDIMAPGEEMPCPTIDGEADLTQGTSHATAIVTGAATLSLSCKVDATANEITEAILEKADERKKLKEYANNGRVLNILNSVKYFCIIDVIENESDEIYYGSNNHEEPNEL